MKNHFWSFEDTKAMNIVFWGAAQYKDMDCARQYLYEESVWPRIAQKIMKINKFQNETMRVPIFYSVLWFIENGHGMDMCSILAVF